YCHIIPVSFLQARPDYQESQFSLLGRSLLVLGTMELSPSLWRQLPLEVKEFIFTEFMSKHALHFALVDEKSWYFDVSHGLPLTSWGDGDIKSGYVSQQVLNATGIEARRAARRTYIEEALVRYNRCPAVVDRATDLLCLVYSLSGGTTVTAEMWGKFDFSLGIADTFGCFRRAGVLITEDMWFGVLEHWFPIQRFGPPHHSMMDYRLHTWQLHSFMDCFADLRMFCMVLINITEDDWNEYYARFPVAFHDYTGSYVEVYEKPIHPEVQLVRRVDAQMGNRLRVSLLLGLLENARLKLSPTRDLRLRVLARKPVQQGGTVNYATPIPEDEDYSGVTLGPKDPEEKWVKQALDTIMSESARNYELDAIANASARDDSAE
ncbi:hypothetical protein CONLIGDRAFT_691870, partial [Coniochaeta ligniaria NRRL 30616]